MNISNLYLFALKKNALPERLAVLLICTLPQDAHARGGESGLGLIFHIMLFILVVRFAPFLSILAIYWCILSVTLLPILAGFYIVIEYTGYVSIFLGIFFIALGALLTKTIAGDEISRVWKMKFIRRKSSSNIKV